MNMYVKISNTALFSLGKNAGQDKRKIFMRDETDNLGVN